jgi:hypothetical protein
MSLTSSFNALPMGVKIGVGAVAVGATIATAVVLSGCASPKDPSDFTKGLFADFDADPRDGGINRNEATKQRVGPIDHQDVFQYRIGDTKVYDHQTIQRSWTDSILKTVNVADTNGDAIAGWDELKALAAKFDTNGDGILKGGEQSNFKHEYGAVETNSRTQILGHEIVFDYPDTRPNYPNSGGGQNGPGDEPGWNPGSGSGGNGPGDIPGSGGHVPGPGSGSGNGSGDEVGSGSRPGTDTGPRNPDESDF